MVPKCAYPPCPYFAALKRLALWGTTRHPQNIFDANNADLLALKQNEDRCRLFTFHLIDTALERHGIAGKGPATVSQWDILMKETIEGGAFPDKVRRRLMDFSRRTPFLLALEAIIQRRLARRRRNAVDPALLSIPAHYNYQNIVVTVFLVLPEEFAAIAPTPQILSVHPIRHDAASSLDIGTSLDVVVPGEFTLQNFLDAFTRTQGQDIQGSRFPIRLEGYSAIDPSLPTSTHHSIRIKGHHQFNQWIWETRDLVFAQQPPVPWMRLIAHPLISSHNHNPLVCTTNPLRRYTSLPAFNLVYNFVLPAFNDMPVLEDADVERAHVQRHALSLATNRRPRFFDRDWQVTDSEPDSAFGEYSDADDGARVYSADEAGGPEDELSDSGYGDSENGEEILSSDGD